MTPNSIRLELLRNLTSETFIAVLKRCRAGRVLIEQLCNDNGTDFVGASRELKARLKSADFLRQAHDCCKDTISVVSYSSEFIPFWRRRKAVIKEIIKAVIKPVIKSLKYQ
jgi:hypothetical protein